jgi:putative oxidoreductase
MIFQPARWRGPPIRADVKRATSNDRRRHSELRTMSSLQRTGTMKITSLFRTLAVSPLPIPTGLYAVPLRLIVGLGFAKHGYAKLARGPDAFGMILHNIGLPFADLLGWATVAVEIVAGLLVLVGAFVPVAALPMIVVLLVTIVTVHLPNGFSSVKLLSYDSTGAHFGQPGYETDLLYLAGLLALCIGGAGPLSFDGYLRGRRSVDRTA